jgi:UDP-N-acetylglucosamine 2-epimerase
MAEKRRYTVTLPDHVADAVESRAKPLGASPTEYAGAVLRWWFGQGCPPVTHDEAALLAAAMKKRVKPLPDDLNAWSLDPKSLYTVTDDKVVKKLLAQLGIPNLFAHASEHDEVRMSVAFDNHPTHWLQLDFFKGVDEPDGNGLSFTAHPKASVTRKEMIQKLQAEAKEMGTTKPFVFSQIPMLENPEHGTQTAVTVKSTC